MGLQLARLVVHPLELLTDNTAESVLYRTTRREPMATIISMQDIRASLSSIAKRAGTGESFVAVRNSRPAFRIEPLSEAHTPAPVPAVGRSVDSITARLDAPGPGADLTADELDRVIHEVHGTTGQA